MRKITLVCSLLLFTLAFGHKGVAQNTSGDQQTPKAQQATQAPPVHYYHVDFVVEELSTDGKPVNSRNYSTTVSTDTVLRPTTSIRTGSRVPIVVGTSVIDGKEHQDIQYSDIGTNFDVHNAHEVGRQLALDLTANLTSVAGTADPAQRHPVIRENRWQASILIPIGKSTVVFTSDSLDSKGSMRVLVTATPVQQ